MDFNLKNLTANFKKPRIVVGITLHSAPRARFFIKCV